MLHCTLMKMAERRCDDEEDALSSLFHYSRYYRVLHTLFSTWHCCGECLHRTTISETQQQMQEFHDRNKQENYNLSNRWNKIIEQYGPREKMTGDVSHDKSLFLVLDRLVNQESKSNIAKIQSASRCYLPKPKYEKNMTFFETLEALHSEGVIGNGNYDILIKILMKADCLSDDIMLEIGETTRKIKCIETTKRHAFSSSESLCSRSSGAFFPFHWTAVEYLLDALLTPSVVIQENISIETTKKHAFNFSTSLCSENWWVSSGPSFASFPSKLTVYQDEVYHQHDALFPVLARLVDQENKSIEKILTASRCYLTKANYKKNMTFLETLIALESEGVIGIGNYEILIRILGKADCLSDDIMLAIEETTQKNKCSEISIRASFPFSVNHVLKLDHVLLKRDKVLEILGSSKMLISNIISVNGFNELQNQRICRDTEVVPQYFIMNGQTRTEKMEESVFLGVTASEPRESSSWKTPRFSERASHNKIGQQIFGISIAFYSEEAGETSDRNTKPATRSGQGNLWMKLSLFMLILLGISVGGSCLPASCPGEILKANVSRDVLIWVNDSKPIRIKRFYLNHLTPQEKETCLSDPVVTEGVERAVVMCVLAVFLQWQIWQHLFYVSFQGLPRTSGKSSRLLMIRVFLCLTVNGSAAESVPKGVGWDDCEFCHQICQPNIMKMNCDKYCSNLCGNERFSAEVFITEPGRDTLYDTVKWFGIVSAVMVIILLLHLFVFSEVSNHLSQGCHDMPGPESVVNDNHCLMYSKRCLFSVFMEAIEKSNLDSKTHNDSVDNDSKEDGDIHSSLKHNNTSEQQREVTLCTSEEPSERKSYDIDSETDDTNATNKNKQITDLTPCNIPIQERDMMLKYRHELIVPMHTDMSERLDFVGQRIFCLELKPLTIDDSKTNVLVMKERAREEFPLSNSTCPFLHEETFCEVSGFTLDFSLSTDFKLKRRKDFYFNWPVHSRKFKTRVQQMQKLHANYHKPNSSTVREDIRRDRSILDRRICDNSKTEGIQKTMFKDDLFKMTDIEEEMINTNEETHEMNWQFPTQRLYDIPSLPITNNPDRTIADSVVKKGQEDDVDDCDILRNITWLPLEDLPVPQIHTDIIVNNAAQVILDRIAKGETVGAQESMKFEILRVCTYRNYPADNKPFRLLFASAGWYYASDNDEVVCYRCGMRKSNWNEADSPLEIHTKIRPGCDFLVKNSEVNLPIPELESAKLIKFKKLDELLDSSVQIPLGQLPSSGNRGNLDLNSSRSPQFRFFTPPPKHPQYALQSVRLDSFKGWPTNIPQTSTTMAECGYYYAGFGDCVRCFYCGIGLRHWTDEDNPWIEHARWSKDCVYLRQMKGEEFIQNVYLAIQEEEEREDVEPETQSGQAGNISQIAPSDDSSQILLTDPAQSVLEMGYQPKIIKRAIDVILHNEGRSGITAMKIMEQIFRFEENSELEQGVANMNIASGSEVQSQNSPSTGQTQNKGNGSKEPNSSTGTKAQSQSVTGQSQENKETGHSENSPKSQGQKKDTNKKAGDTVQTRSKEPSATGKQEEAAASAKPSPQSSLDENVKGAIAENSENDTTKIKAENRKLKEQTICKVCLDKAVSFVFLPCGHLVTCAECAPAMKKCPICRGLVKGSVKAFMS